MSQNLMMRMCHRCRRVDTISLRCSRYGLGGAIGGCVYVWRLDRVVKSSHGLARKGEQGTHHHEVEHVGGPKIGNNIHMQRNVVLTRGWLSTIVFLQSRSGVVPTAVCISVRKCKDRLGIRISIPSILKLPDGRSPSNLSATHGYMVNGQITETPRRARQSKMRHPIIT